MLLISQRVWCHLVSVLEKLAGSYFRIYYVAVQSECRCERLYSVIGRIDICNWLSRTACRTWPLPIANPNRLTLSLILTLIVEHPHLRTSAFFQWFTVPCTQFVQGCVALYAVITFLIAQISKEYSVPIWLVYRFILLICWRR